MNKRIFITLAVTLVAGMILYKMPSQAGGDAQSTNLRSRLQPRTNFDWRPDDPPAAQQQAVIDIASAIAQLPVSRSMRRLQDETIARRSQVGTERAAKVQELLEPVMTPENMPFLSQIVILFGYLIQWLNYDYIELLKKIHDERELTIALRDVNHLSHRHAKIKIEALERRVAELEAAAAEQTEY